MNGHFKRLLSEITSVCRTILRYFNKLTLQQRNLDMQDPFMPRYSLPTKNYPVLNENKRPKGPHNVRLSTMCHLFWRIGQGCYFYLLFDPINTNLVEDVEILLPVKFRWIPFSGFRGKVKIRPSQSEARAAILFFWSARTLVKDVENSSFRGEVENVSANLVEGIEILLSVKFRWIPFSGLEEKSKMSQPIRGQGGHLVLPIGRKTQTW